MRTEDLLQAVVTVLSLVNPAVCGAIFANVEAGQPRREQIANATRAAFAILVILVLAALFGVKLLHAFGVSLDAFSVAGGGILVWMGFSMLTGKAVPSAASKSESADAKPSLTPLVLFGASPGTITGVITISASHSGLKIPVTALLAALVATALTWAVMVLVSGLRKPDAVQGFVSDTVRSFMGLIVIAMGVQFALNGLKSFFGAAG